MSLHVGQIPPHIRPEELERVFQRFGRCRFRMKDGYGFAVYEISADADTAFRALRGKNICGAPLSLNWSNRQPKPFLRPARSGKVYEPYRRRNFREEGNGPAFRGSEDRRDFSTGNFRIPPYNRRKHQEDVSDRRAGYTSDCLDDDIGEEMGLTLKAGEVDVGNSSEPNPLEIERWGEPVSDAMAVTEMQKNSEFDRYEPYHNHDREDEKDNDHGASSYGSPYHGSPIGRRRREHPTDGLDQNMYGSKPQPTCYHCGLVGHIKRYCPEGDANRENFGKFSHRRDEINFRGRNDGRRKMPRTSSFQKRDSTRDSLMFRYQEGSRKQSHLGKSRSLVKRSENFAERREMNQTKVREEPQVKKRREQLSETRHDVLKKRRSRRFHSSSVSSESSSSSSHSHSGTSKSKSHTSSRSVSSSSSSSSRSLSPSSRSASVSAQHKSKRSRSRSRSMSSSHRSPSLSVSLDKKPPSSPINVNHTVSEDRASPQGNLESRRSLSSRHHLHDNMRNFEVKNRNGSVTHKIDNGTDGEHSGDNVDEAHHSAPTPTSGYKESNAGMNLTNDAAAVSENDREKCSLQEIPPEKLNEQIADDSEGRNSTRITPQELILALKHYGLPAPEKGDSEMSVDGYFGAARLWPWEMIYYRRLKKGPISTENYARRLQQNKEFGIVDRYVRSSSGWGECGQNDLL